MSVDNSKLIAEALDKLDISTRMSGALTVDQAKEVIQYALQMQVNDILLSMYSQLADMNSPKDLKHTYGFELAIDLIKDNFIEDVI